MATPQDTIVAVSSPPGRSLRGLVRLSGPMTPAILQAMLTTPMPPARELSPVAISLHPSASSDHATHSIAAPADTLPVLLLRFDAPASYTGQAMAELQCPGHPWLLQALVHQAIHHGARLAEPGEFTFRAYLAGKLDLTQAEGVAATIAAQSDAQLHAAGLLREGKLGQLAHQLVDTLGDALAAVEAGIDFTDQEDVRPIAGDALTGVLTQLMDEVDRTLAASRNWGSLDALPSVVLVGSPSVGKSTLFNALLGVERSVISPQPGTTRDILAEPLTIPHLGRVVQVMLTDIAGLDHPLTAMDRLVQQAARDAMAQADVLLCVGDHQTPPPALPADSKQATVIRVRTKGDLPATRSVSDDELPVISPAGVGLDALRRAIAQGAGERGISHAGERLALQPRHEQAFVETRHHLEQAQAVLAWQTDATGVDQPELVASAMRAALDQLAAIGGQMTPDDVIGKVFAKFCVGK